MNSRITKNRFFLFLLVLVSLTLFFVIKPFISAIFWAVIFATLFASLNQKFKIRFSKSPNFAAFYTLMICLFVVILPLVFVGISVIQETLTFYEQINSGKINFAKYLSEIKLSPTLNNLLNKFDLNSIENIQTKLSELVNDTAKFLFSYLLSMGGGTLSFLVSFAIMVYLLFFLLRDGEILVSQIYQAIPLEEEYKQKLISRFTMVIKATVKGNLMVAIIQGFLGGLIFIFLGISGAILWGTIMVILSLLPAVGASLIWGPVAIYFLATGSIVKAIILILYGAIIIGLADNVLRPILVGKDTKLPDYAVLISTLGGISLFGLPGFIMGPAIAVLFLVCWEIFNNNYQTDDNLSI